MQQQQQQQQKQQSQNQQQQQQQKKNKNNKKVKEENKVAAIFKESKGKPENEFEEWCISALDKLDPQVDIPTFLGFLNDVESPYEVRHPFCFDSKFIMSCSPHGFTNSQSRITNFSDWFRDCYVKNGNENYGISEKVW